LLVSSCHRSPPHRFCSAGVNTRPILRPDAPTAGARAEANLVGPPFKSGPTRPRSRSCRPSTVDDSRLPRCARAAIARKRHDLRFQPTQFPYRAHQRMIKRRARSSSASGSRLGGPLTIDPATFSVRLGGRAVSLSPLNFDLLLYLARHQARVVSLEELGREVFKRTAGDVALVVRVHIWQVRHALGSRVLTTIRGRGYRLTSPLDDSGLQTQLTTSLTPDSTTSPTWNARAVGRPPSALS
jgi:DNA-binding winged helix-turn-helix (wHTH) protein